MLPFLANRKAMTTAILSRRGKSPDIKVNPEIEAPGHEMDHGMKSASEEVMRAIESKSVIDLAKALHNAFQLFDSMPHEEAEHEDQGE